MDKKYVVREVCCGKEPQYLIQKDTTFYLSKVKDVYEAATFSTKEDAEFAYENYAQAIPVEIVEIFSKD